MPKPDNSRDDNKSEDFSGAKEKFWDEHYRPERYVNADGTVVPLWDQIEIEETCRKQRFDPSKDGARLRGEDPF